MNTLKRPAEPIESPGLTFKRRCISFIASPNGSPLLDKKRALYARPTDENTTNNLLQSNIHHPHKRARTESYASASSRELVALEPSKRRHEDSVSRLKSELSEIKREAHTKLRKADALNQELRETVCKQSQEIDRLNHENRILKGGIRALNKQREESISQHHHKEIVLQDQSRKIKQLEQSLHALRMHLAQASCGSSIRHPGWDGGGPVY